MVDWQAMTALRWLVVIASLFTTAHAEGIPGCAPHDEMAATLLKQAQEWPVRMGINKDRALIETYASIKGTWTDVRTNMLTGVSCITDFGVNYQGRLVPEPEQGA